jgi:hypothetical protein
MSNSKFDNRCQTLLHELGPDISLGTFFKELSTDQISKITDFYLNFKKEISLNTNKNKLLFVDQYTCCRNLSINLLGDNFVDLDIVAANNSLPIVRGGVLVSNFTATPGFSGVYQGVCATAPALHNASNPVGYVFIQSLPYDLINSSDRRPAHLGRSHRSPHTPLFAGPTSIASLFLATKPRWWYDPLNQLLYVFRFQ